MRKKVLTGYGNAPEEITTRKQKPGPEKIKDDQLFSSKHKIYHEFKCAVYETTQKTCQWISVHEDFKISAVKIQKLS